MSFIKVSIDFSKGMFIAAKGKPALIVAAGAGAAVLLAGAAIAEGIKTGVNILNEKQK